MKCYVYPILTHAPSNKNNVVGPRLATVVHLPRPPPPQKKKKARKKRKSNNITIIRTTHNQIMWLPTARFMLHLRSFQRAARNSANKVVSAHWSFTFPLGRESLENPPPILGSLPFICRVPSPTFSKNHRALSAYERYPMQRELAAWGPLQKAPKIIEKRDRGLPRAPRSSIPRKHSSSRGWQLRPCLVGSFVFEGPPLQAQATRPCWELFLFVLFFSEGSFRGLC